MEGTSNVDPLICKFDLKGTLLWSWSNGTESFDSFQRVLVDDTDAVVVVGSSLGAFGTELDSSGNHDVIVCKFDSDGNVVYAVQYGTYSTDTPRDATIGPFGHVYVSGDTTGSFGSIDNSAASQDLFLLKIRCADGALIDAWQLALPNGTEFQQSIAVDVNNVIYLSGRTSSPMLNGIISSGVYDVYWLRMPVFGNISHTVLFGTSGFDTPKDIVVDTSGNSYILGTILPSDNETFYGHSGFGSRDVFIIKLSPNGTVLDTFLFGTTGNDFGERLLIDLSSDRLFGTARVVGSLNGEIYSGASDAAILSLDLNLNLQSTFQYGTASNDYASGMALGCNGSQLYVTGFTQGSLYATNGGDNDFTLSSFTLPTHSPSPQAASTAGEYYWHFCNVIF